MSELAALLGAGDGPAIRPSRQVTHNVRVSREGDLVVLELGSTLIRLQARDAIKIGQWLLAKGFEGKMLRSETQRVWIDPGQHRL